MSGTSRRELSRCHEPEAEQEAEGGRRAGLARSQTSRTATSALARRRTLRVQGRAFTGPARSSAETSRRPPRVWRSVRLLSFIHSFIRSRKGRMPPVPLLHAAHGLGSGARSAATRRPGSRTDGPGGQTHRQGTTRRRRRPSRASNWPPRAPKAGATGRGRNLPAAPAPEWRPRSAARRPARGEPWRELSLGRLRQSGPAGAPASLWTSLRRGRLPRRLRNGLWHPPPSRVLQGK